MVPLPQVSAIRPTTPMAHHPHASAIRLTILMVHRLPGLAIRVTARALIARQIRNVSDFLD